MCLCVCAYQLSAHFIRYLLDLLLLADTSRFDTCSEMLFCIPLLYNGIYLCYCHLPVSFDQSGPSPLTSLINNAFLPAELLLTGCVFFSHHSLQTLETVV